MAIHAQNKGKEGEREVARVMNAIILELLKKHDLPIPERDVVQRNQNQSAVGGSDLSNTFGLCVEIKRQEQLSVNTWWKQTLEAARHNGETPVLIFRQNHKPWRVVTMAWLPLPAGDGSWASTNARVEFDWDTFQQWFREWVDRKLLNGEKVRV